MRKSDEILENLLSLHPKRIDLTLDRVVSLLHKLGNPQQSLPPVVHIAGTNGKGSTLAYLMAIAKSAGLRVHRYTSPHLVRFHERITLAGQNIGEKDLSALLNEVEKAQGNDPITFFEITTAAAMLAFSRTPADLLLLETGLGGRLDATNVIPKPLVCALSPIDIDHQEFLGDTLELITKEKVEIARPDVPLVSAPQKPEAEKVITRYCEKHSIPLFYGGKIWQYKADHNGFTWTMDKENHHYPRPALVGDHQIDNAALATTIAHLLKAKGIPISQKNIAMGLQEASWLGRLQKVRQGRYAQNLPKDVSLWLDGGHNLHAGKALKEYLQSLPEVRLIIGMLGNKDCSGYLDLLSDFLDNAQSLTIPNSDAALSAVEIAKLHSKISPAQGFAEAITRARQSGGKNIVICGSLYLIGEMLAENEI